MTLDADLDVQHLEALAQLSNDADASGSAVTVVPVITDRKIDMTFSIAPESPIPGEQITVQLSVQNNAGRDLQDLAIQFRHPTSMARIYDNGGSTTDTSDACNGSYCGAGERVNWTGLSIAAGTSKTVEMTTVVDGTATPGQLIEFWAKVEENGTIQRASAKTTITVVSDQNILTNPGFENDLSGWVTDSATTRSSDPLPYKGTAYLFGASNGDSSSYTYQDVILTEKGFSISDISSGNLTAKFGGWQSGWHEQTDSGQIELIQLDESGNSIQTDQLNSFYSNNTWLLQSNSTSINPTTRTLRLGFRALGYEGDNLDAYLDQAYIYVD